MKRIFSLGIIVATLALITGCGPQTPAPAASPFKPTATIQDIMTSIVDPAADFIWDAVSTEVTKSGTVNKLPQNEAEWVAIRHQAITLIEAANLLVMDGRRVAAAGTTLEDARTPGILTVAQAQKAIDGDRQTFIGHAYELQDAAVQALVAIDAKNPDALVKAGGAIDKSCEQCHLKYWYPNGGAPKLEDLRARIGKPRRTQ
jgi:hypothetical protein